MNALLLVDLQNDFFPSGALGIKDSDQILPWINHLLKLPFDLIIATQDWHPKDHLSFAANHDKMVGEKIQLQGLEQILWPPHCIQNSPGACLHPALHSEKIDKIFHKGIDRQIDSYSAFFDNGHFQKTGLDRYLKEKKIETLYIAGLATDYCVKYSTLDALELGFNVYVIANACCAVELQSGDEKAALKEMAEAGAKIIATSEVNALL